jgi:PAS domain S-box-containing protein
MSKHTFLGNIAKIRQSIINLSALESLLNYLPNAAILVNTANHRILSANVKACEMTAYARAELIDLPLEALLSTAGGTSISTLIDHNLTMDMQPGFECDVIHHSGSRIASLLTITRLAGSDGYFLINITSQEEQRRSTLEMVRRESAWLSLNALLTAYTQSDLPTAVQTILSAGEVLAGASALCIYQADGQSPIMRQVATRDPEAILPLEIPPQDLGYLNRASLWLSGKRPLTTLHRQARAAKLAFTASTPIGEANTTIGIFVAAGNTPPPGPILEILQFLANLVYILVQNKTLIHQLHDDLKASKLSQLAYETVINSIDDGLIFLTPDLQIVQLNTAAELALGYANPEVKDQDVKNILICNENLETSFRFAQDEFRPGSLSNLRLYRRNGDSFLANLRIMPIAATEVLHSILIILHDLSEQEEYKTRNQQLEQRATLADITASFAHEVRNPINNISTGLQLLAVNLSSEDPNQENISRLQNDCERLADLVKSGLSFVRPVEYKLEPVDLGKVISHLMDRWRNRISRTKVKYNSQIDSNVPPVEGDLRALEQVFTNLIDNAIQSMEPAGGILTINLRHIRETEGRSHVEVNIIDTGPGIPPNAKEHIFEPFFTTKQNGTGLGLAIVKRIVTAHKGSIHVSSIPGGTMFQVRIPSC